MLKIRFLYVYCRRMRVGNELNRGILNKSIAVSLDDIGRCNSDCAPAEESGQMPLLYIMREAYGDIYRIADKLETMKKAIVPTNESAEKFPSNQENIVDLARGIIFLARKIEADIDYLNEKF